MSHIQDRRRDGPTTKRPRFGQPGGGRGGGAGGGRFGRDNRGGGRGRESYDGPRGNDYTFPVKTNYFRLELTDNVVIYQYSISIRNAKKMRLLDSEGKPITDQNGRFKTQFALATEKPGRNTQVDMKKAAQLSRRILLKLKNHVLQADAHRIVTDGSPILFSAGPLFDQEPQDIPSQSIEIGKYGLADDGQHDGSLAPIKRNAKLYFVTVKKDCDEDDDDAERVKNAHFAVELTEVGQIDTANILKGHLDAEQMSLMQQAFSIIIRSGMLGNSRLINFTKRPGQFYLKDPQGDLEEKVCGRALLEALQNTIRGGLFKTYTPLVGLATSICIGQNGHLFQEASAVATFVNRSHKPLQNPRKETLQKVALIQENPHTIAGVPVRDLHRPLDDDLLKRIEDGIKRLELFHVEYTNNDPEFKKRMEEVAKKHGWNKEKLEKKLKCVRKNCTLKRDPDHDNKSLIRTSKELTFSPKPPRRRRNEATTEDEKEPPPEELPAINVEEYFYQRYKIRLKYPNLPLVFIGKKEWYPIEFCYQCLTKRKDANADHDVRTMLGFYDEISGKAFVDRVCEVRNLLEGMSLSDDLYSSFRMKRSSEPVRLRGRVLQQPDLRFQDGVMAQVYNGDWNLRDKRFAEPSVMTSFVIVDFTRSSRSSAGRFMTDLYQAMDNHGILLPAIDARELIPRITISADNLSPHGVHEAFETARTRAKDIFLFDNENLYKNKKIWFRSRCINRKGTNDQCDVSDCLVLSQGRTEGKIGIMLPSDQFYNTHEIRLKNGTTLMARLVVIVRDVARKLDEQYDPFQLQLHHQKRTCVNGEEKEIVGYAYHNAERNETFAEDLAVTDSRPCLFLHEDDVIFDPIVFAYLPDDKHELYHLIKMISHFDSGIISQCVVQAKYEKQRTPQQYCSNIALKVNGKLSSALSQPGRAWHTSLMGQEGIPWLNEIPTLVIGVDISHGLGSDSISVIAATVSLDIYCMQMGHSARCHSKSNIIAPEVFEEMVQECYDHFIRSVGFRPQRILYYRCGASEGQFADVFTKEVLGIRKVFSRIRREMDPKFQCLNSKCANGCVYCTPPITAIICQTQHQIRIVPDDHEQSCNNVPSGTVVDQEILSTRNWQKLATKDIPKDVIQGVDDRILMNSYDDGFDFVLVSHGGLKGTSKPVYYRVLWNENAVWGVNEASTPLTRDALELMTYHMSFQYTTATKSVRTVPVVYYSARLASRLMGYINWLRGRRENAEPLIAAVPLDDKEGLPIRRNRDGNVIENVKYIRNEIFNHGPKGLPYGIQTELLNRVFTPYGVTLDYDESYVRPAFYPHISA